MKEKNIQILLDKYFEGTTTCKEEKLLRNFFCGKSVPEDLTNYIPIFTCFSEEIKERTQRKPHNRRTLYIRYTWSAVAASVLILIGIAGLKGYDQHSNTNYVIINGEKHVDIHLAEQQARKAFEEVSFSETDLAADLIPENMKENS